MVLPRQALPGFSRSNLNVSRNDATVTAMSPPEAAKEIGGECGLSRVWLAGGGELAGAFRDHGLITE
jgi:dihydrofolate reductase